MKSPFPGMDPYLERLWGDMQHRLITYTCELIQAQLPEPLVARTDDHVYVERYELPPRRIRPDVFVVEHPPGVGNKGGGAGSESGAVAVAEPYILKAVEEEVHQGYVEIIDPKYESDVITAIEILSPSNKAPGPGRDEYVRKQGEFLAARVNLVELDLVRSGVCVLALPGKLPPAKQTPCLICVRRGMEALTAEVYSLPLRAPLPVIAIPLRESDRDIPFDVQALLDRVYDAGQLRRLIDYTKDPEPPLDPDDAQWADALLRSQGLR